ncbi:hypothetical protein FSP39_017524 [Pinctada imbricata]|uniref:Uncharacterized protein n=1 Tax=Pinctada imbricata TaxID=66713 RepID=A0AA88XTC2_PINIB|nr:hypothetical protein FSP39_017524 [Pinctada imbricata]
MVNKVKPLKDKGEVNEMPKPNIVSSFRSMFEKSSGQVPRKILPDSPKVFTSQRNQTNLSVKPNTQTADISTSPVSENSVKPSVSVSRENKVAERDVDETANVRPSTMKEKAKETPRLLDSPVTRKKTYPEKKSIFDSDSDITTKKTSPRRFSQSEKNEKRDDLPSVNVTSNIESAVQAEKDKKVPATNKSSVTVASNEESMGKEVFPTRKEVFDSSMIAKIPKKSEQRSKVENDDRKEKSQDVLHAKKEVFDSSVISKSKDKKVSKPKEEYSEERNKKSEDVVQKRKEIFDSKSTENSGISSKTRSLHGKTKQAPATPLVNSQITEDVKSTQNEVSEITKHAKISSEKENIESKKVQSVPEEKGHKSLNSVQNVPKQNILQNVTTTKDIKSTNVEKIESNSSRSDLEPTGSKNNRVQDNEPKKGIPSVIANRLNKTKPVQDNKKDLKNENLDDNGEEVIHSSNLRPSQLKKGTLINGTTSSQQERTALCSFGMSNTTNNKKKSPGAKTEPVSNFDDLIGGKRNSPVPLFDSASSIVPKAKPKPSAQGVPPLDLSDLMPTEKNHPYQEGYIPTKIEPCKLVIVGAPVLLKTTPLKKTRSGHQLKIQFDDSAVQTHEYPREEVALEEYLSTNPAEVEEAKREEQAREEEPPEDPLEGPQIGDIPRQGESTEEGQETPRKNFTSSLEAGELSKYKPKHQEEFVFGMSLKEPEKAPATEVGTETSTEDDLHLRPADEDDLHDFSTHDTSDMLF